MQRSPTIVPPRIDRNAHRKQNPGDPDVPCPSGGVQQGPAVGLLSNQDPGNFDMPFTSGPAQRGLTIV